VISPPGQQKILGLWMERSGARVLAARPREPCSAPSAVLRALRVDLLLSCDQGVRVVDRINDSDPLNPGAPLRRVVRPEAAELPLLQRRREHGAEARNEYLFRERLRVRAEERGVPAPRLQGAQGTLERLRGVVVEQDARLAVAHSVERAAAGEGHDGAARRDPTHVLERGPRRARGALCAGDVRRQQDQECLRPDREPEQ